LKGCVVECFDIRRRRQHQYLLLTDYYKRCAAVLHYGGHVASNKRIRIGTVRAINGRLFTLPFDCLPLFNGLRSNQRTVKAYCYHGQASQPVR
jgi:hypothetical protein